jgi:hypothetical protein
MKDPVIVVQYPTEYSKDAVVALQKTIETALRTNGIICIPSDVNITVLPIPL